MERSVTCKKARHCQFFFREGSNNTFRALGGHDPTDPPGSATEVGYGIGTGRYDTIRHGAVQYGTIRNETRRDETRRRDVSGLYDALRCGADQTNG